MGPPGRFAELARALRLGGRLGVTMHRQVLPVDPAVLADETRDAGLAEVHVAVRPRQRNELKVEFGRHPALIVFTLGGVTTIPQRQITSRWSRRSG